MSSNAENSQITKEKLKELKKIKTSSFAIWLDAGENDIEKKFIENLEKLKSKIILLAINPAYEIQGDFINFHDGSNTEIFIRNNISKCEALKGAYMTDISQTAIGTADGLKINDYDIKIFKNQLEILGEKEYFIVCFGVLPFRELQNGENSTRINDIEFVKVKRYGYTLHCYRVLHYSPALRFPSKKPKFIQQLKEANDLISKHLIIQPENKQ